MQKIPYVPISLVASNVYAKLAFLEMELTFVKVLELLGFLNVFNLQKKHCPPKHMYYIVMHLHLKKFEGDFTYMQISANINAWMCKSLYKHILWWT